VVKEKTNNESNGFLASIVSKLNEGKSVALSVCVSYLFILQDKVFFFFTIETSTRGLYRKSTKTERQNQHQM
jgi:hypothetical protein